MWVYIVRHILRNRLGNLIAILLVTAFMAYQATQVKMSYEFSSLLPASDTASIVYAEFKERFGQDGSVLFIGFQDKELFELDKFADYYKLTYDIKDIDGVEEVISVPRMFYLSKDTSVKKFDFKPVIEVLPTRQSQV
ncbi:MAG: patched family protein, partial [Bacteroidetes bacterium]